MADVGPPTRVVPVSIAAYDAEPDVRLTELPFTASPMKRSNHQQTIRREKHKPTKALGHTGELLYPVTLLAAGDGLVIDRTGEQRGVGRTKVERPSGLKLLCLRVVDEPRELECHERLVQCALTVCERLPEGGRAGRGDGLETETHQSRHGGGQ